MVVMVVMVVVGVAAVAMVEAGEVVGSCVLSHDLQAS